MSCDNIPPSPEVITIFRKKNKITDKQGLPFLVYICVSKNEPYNCE